MYKSSQCTYARRNTDAGVNRIKIGTNTVACQFEIPTEKNHAESSTKTTTDTALLSRMCLKLECLYRRKGHEVNWPYIYLGVETENHY